MFSTDTHARFVATRGHKKGVLAQINALILAHKSRVALAQLDETGRADVGLTPQDVKAELARPLWDVPAAWRSR